MEEEVPVHRGNEKHMITRETEFKTDSAWGGSSFIKAFSVVLEPGNLLLMCPSANVDSKS